MIINNLSSYGNSKAPEILAHAQTISNFFIDAIEQNDCNLKVVIGYYFELDDSMKTAEDLAKALEADPITNPTRFTTPSTSYIGTPSVIIKTPEGIDQAVNALKDRCFDCKLSLPKIKFEKDFRFIYNKLTFQLEVYRNIFPKLNRPSLTNYCHVSFSLQKACVPDILKVIAMLLTALSAIMALNKLPKISLGAFVKAIIGKLMASVVANIKLSVDMSQTGLPCILSAIEEIANAIPTRQQIYDLEMSDELRGQLFPKEPYETLSGKKREPFVPYTTFMRDQDAKLRSKQITKEEYDNNIREYRKRNEPARYYAQQIRQQTEMYQDRAEEKISEAFGKVSDVLTKAQDDVNAYIKALLGVIDYFECESARTGPDFTELIEYINNLQEVINFFSSVLGIWLAKMFEPLLCMDGITHNQVRQLLSDPEQTAPLSNSDLADILQEFTGKVTKLDNDGVSILIYDKPAKQMLPKLSIVGCNLKEFAEAHQIDNLIRTAVDNANNTSPTNSGNTNNLPNYVRDLANPPSNTTTSPIIVPPPYYYAPIPVEIPKAIRDIPVKIPFTLLDKLRVPFPTGTDKIIPYIPTNTYTNIPSGTSPYNPNKIVPPGSSSNPNLPSNIAKIIEKVKEQEASNDGVIDRIDLGTGTYRDKLPTILTEIDDLLDFIYNNPRPDRTEQVDDYVSNTGDSIVSPFGVGGNNTSSGGRDTEFLSKRQECQSFEDVLNILNSL